MTINQKTLQQAKDGYDAIKRTGRSVYIHHQNDLPQYIEWMVEKGNTYYVGQGVDEYVYWEGNVYGFTFNPKIFDLFIKP